MIVLIKLCDLMGVYRGMSGVRIKVVDLGVAAEEFFVSHFSTSCREPGMSQN